MAGVTKSNDFRLCSVADGRGVSCDGRGAFIGTVPLLQRQQHPTAGEIWAPRSADELNTALSVRYGFPIDMATKLDGLRNVAQALNRGDIFNAQLGTLDMKLPNPPPAAGGLPFGNQIARLAMLLHGSSMLDHGSIGTQPPPNIPANSNGPDRAMPAPVPANENHRLSGADDYGRLAGNRQLPVTPAEFFLPSLAEPWIETIPIPPETAPFPPMPNEIGPLPLVEPDRLRPETPLENPYPENPECEKEWDEAYVFCRKYINRLKKGLENGAFGVTEDQCLRGRVSARCGGNETA